MILLSHWYKWVPEYSKRRKKKRPHVNDKSEKNIYDSRFQESNRCWETPASHHIRLLLSPTSLKCRAGGVLEQCMGNVMFLLWLGYEGQQSNCSVIPRTALCDLRPILSKHNKKLCCRLVRSMLPSCKHTSGKKYRRPGKVTATKKKKKKQSSSHNKEINSTSNLKELQCMDVTAHVSLWGCVACPRQSGCTQTHNPHNCVLFQTAAFVIRHTAA